MEEKQLLLGESSQQSAIDPSLLRRMYVGHFLSRWGARMWEFSVALYMINIWPDSLLFTAIYGVVEAASTTLFGPVVGTWIEKIAYKQVLRMWLLIRSLSFLAAGGAVTALLVYFGPASHKSVPFVALLVITNISGAISVLSTLAGTILIERDCFGNLMTATLEWKGIPAYVFGIARGISAIIGIMATVVYPIVHSRISTLRTGLWSIWTQWGFLLACLASIWINNSITSAWMLMGGVAASRLGLWMFDLGVMQLMQDQVSEADRCIVGGVQSSLQSMLDLLTCIMGMVVCHLQ